MKKIPNSTAYGKVEWVYPDLIKDKLNVIYLAAYKADLCGVYSILKYHANITYQDINGKRDIGGDMMDVDLTPYDFIIATPPCNYYSRANWRRESSKYSQATKHLLPDILHKLQHQDKPFIVENVRNRKLMKDFLDLEGVYRYEIGRHTYWTNVKLSDKTLMLMEHFQEDEDIQNTPQGKRQGGNNVNIVIALTLGEVCTNPKYKEKGEIYGNNHQIKN